MVKEKRSVMKLSLPLQSNFGKKGASHIEMIISFIFFIGFIFFLFLFLKPYDTTILSGSVVAGLYNTFEEAAHTNLTSLFLKANYTGPRTCFNITLPNNIFLYALTGSRITNLSDTLIDSSIEEVGDNTDLNIGAKDIFYRVAISPEFGNETLSGCDNLSTFVLGSKLERRVISYSALENMRDDYVKDYDKLKASLGVPGTFEFFIFSEDLPDIEMKNKIPSSVEVTSYEYILEVLNSTGEITNARFVLGTW